MASSMLSRLRRGGALHARALAYGVRPFVATPAVAKAAPPVAPFQFTEVYPAAGPQQFPYRKLTGDFVSTVPGPGGVPILKVEPEALTLLAAQAMTDIAHLLRPGHLQQLANILKVEPPPSPPSHSIGCLDGKASGVPKTQLPTTRTSGKRRG